MLGEAIKSQGIFPYWICRICHRKKD